MLPPKYAMPKCMVAMDAMVSANTYEQHELGGAGMMPMLVLGIDNLAFSDRMVQKGIMPS